MFFSKQGAVGLYYALVHENKVMKDSLPRDHKQF